MLIIRKNQTNNLIATVSMNKTLPNPYYLFSFQHITSKERISFYPQVITTNVRYDKFRFIESSTTNLGVTPPQVFFQYLGQYYYSIYENVSSGSTDISLTYNKLESGRAWVIVGDDNTQECFFEPYISNDEDFAQVIYVSEQEEECIYLTPTITPSVSQTPNLTPSVTPTNTKTPTPTPTNIPYSLAGALASKLDYTPFSSSTEGCNSITALNINFYTIGGVPISNGVKVSEGNPYSPFAPGWYLYTFIGPGIPNPIKQVFQLDSGGIVINIINC
jgi:hypothetical protein